MQVLEVIGEMIFRVVSPCQIFFRLARVLLITVPTVFRAACWSLHFFRGFPQLPKIGYLNHEPAVLDA